MSESDHGRVAGTNRMEIELFGKTYTLRPYTVGVWAEMSSFVRSQKGDPIKEVCDRLDQIPSSQQQRWMKAAVEAAANQSPTEAEMSQFEKSMLGVAFKLWCLVLGDPAKRKTEAKDELADFPTPQSMLDKLVLLSEKEGPGKLNEVMLKIEAASGMADIKNSDGQPATAS